MGAKLIIFKSAHFIYIKVMHSIFTTLIISEVNKILVKLFYLMIAS